MNKLSDFQVQKLRAVLAISADLEAEQSAIVDRLSHNDGLRFTLEDAKGRLQRAQAVRAFAARAGSSQGPVESADLELQAIAGEIEHYSAEVDRLTKLSAAVAADANVARSVSNGLLEYLGRDPSSLRATARFGGRGGHHPAPLGAGGTQHAPGLDLSGVYAARAAGRSS